MPRPWLAPLAADEEPLPPLSNDAFRERCDAFKLKTGIGSDGFHPKHWARLSETGVSAIVSFLILVEGSLYWPEQASWQFYFLIPKTEGGLRPIGIMASLVRVWEQLRKPVMAKWLAEQGRSYDWAVVGRSAEAAVWAE